jgi:hypothetical protein
VTEDWPFEDSPNVAVLTTTAVVKGGMPILRVTHDDDDGAWQFHTGHTVNAGEAMIVALREIVKRDPSVTSLADLPYGWIAVRESVTSEWRRSPHP